jgi:hypothetical protein
LEPWVGAGAIILSSMCGAAFTYGVMSGKVGSLQMQITNHDEEIKERVTRTEYESRHQDILRTLTRIETKVDHWGRPE